MEVSQFCGEADRAESVATIREAISPTALPASRSDRVR